MGKVHSDAAVNVTLHLAAPPAFFNRVADTHSRDQ
jgi:hypothetical protein